MSTTDLSTTRRFEVLLEHSASGWTSATVLGWEEDRCVSATCIAMVGPADARADHDRAREQAGKLADTLGVEVIEHGGGF